MSNECRFKTGDLVYIPSNVLIRREQIFLEGIVSLFITSELTTKPQYGIYMESRKNDELVTNSHYVILKGGRVVIQEKNLYYARGLINGQYI